METNKSTQPASSSLPPRMDTLKFEDTEVAFAAKSNAELKQAYQLFRLIDRPFLMTVGKHFTRFALNVGLPIKGAIKATIFKQFCGGESISECAKTMQRLALYDIGSILDYAVEGTDKEEEFDSIADEIIHTIDTAKENDHIPFSVFKPSAISDTGILTKVSRGEELTEKENTGYLQFRDRVDRICAHAHASGVPLFIDAEESWYQKALDELVMDMMRKYNRERAIVYNTLQMYRHDRIAHMKDSYATAEKEGFVYALKLVRGAYMEKERDRAEKHGYPSPIQPDKPATDRDFNAAVMFSLDHIERMAVCVGTHNEDSCLLMADEMEKRGLDKRDPRLYFAQLYGMSDHISYNLSKAGYNVAKYVPYGPVKKVMPYLIRRAEENTSVKGQSGRELRLIRRELNRRKKSGRRR